MKLSEIMPDDASLEAIRRNIEQYEQRRSGAHRTMLWRLPVGIGAVALATLGAALFFNRLANPYEQWLSTPHVFLYFGAFLALIFALLWAQGPADRLQKALREALMPIIFGFVEDVRYANGAEPESFARMPKTLLPSFDRKRFDDSVSGRHEGFPFELYEARLAEKSGKSEKVRFKGVIVAFALARPFPGELVATRRAGSTLSFLRSFFGRPELDELKSGNPAIDDIYAFHTDNPQAAGPLVTGDLARALSWLAESWPEDQARIAMKDGDGFLLLPTQKNFFELPAISVPLDYRQHVEPLIAELGSLLATAALVRKIGAGGEPGPAGTAA